jgi:hypothetical protein
VLPAGGLSLEELQRFELVILPAVTCLSAEDATVLDSFVAQGGALIATADTGTNTEAGAPWPAPVLTSTRAITGPAKPAIGAYFELVDPVLRARLAGIPHIGADGPFWTVEGSDTEDDLRLIGPFANNAPEFTVVRGPGAAPGLATNRHGAGRTVTLPWRPGALYHRTAFADYRAVMAHILTRLIGAPPISTDAPLAVEFVLTNHPRGQLLHMLNAATISGKTMASVIPLAGFTVRLRSQAKAAWRLDTNTALPLEIHGPEICFHLDRLDAFAAVILLDARPLPAEDADWRDDAKG